MTRGGLALAGLLTARVALAADLEAPEATVGSTLRYELPAAGSYELPPIAQVGEHTLLAMDGEATTFPSCPPGGVAVVGFVYLSCTDTAGCPLSLSTLQRLDRSLASRPEFSSRVRVATVSFDPSRDGPEQMAQLHHHMSPRSDWRFLTAASVDELRPVLEDYGQDAVPLVSAGGTAVGIFRHVTKVFLVDDSGAVRNIYSTGFLDHRLVLRDIETLLLERPEAR